MEEMGYPTLKRCSGSARASREHVTMAVISAHTRTWENPCLFSHFFAECYENFFLQEKERKAGTLEDKKPNTELGFSWPRMKDWLKGRNLEKKNQTPLERREGRDTGGRCEWRMRSQKFDLHTSLQGQGSETGPLPGRVPGRQGFGIGSVGCELEKWENLNRGTLEGRNLSEHYTSLTMAEN